MNEIINKLQELENKINLLEKELIPFINKEKKKDYQKNYYENKKNNINKNNKNKNDKIVVINYDSHIIDV